MEKVPVKTKGNKVSKNSQNKTFRSGLDEDPEYETSRLQHSSVKSSYKYSDG